MKDAGAGAGRQSDLYSQRFEPCAVRVRQDHSPHMGCRNRLLALESRTAKMVGWCLSFRILDATIQQIASPCVAVNGRDKRRAQRAAIDCPAWVRCAVTKAGKAKGACPPILILCSGASCSGMGAHTLPCRMIARLKALQFLIFCDTILILKIEAAANTSANH